MSRLVKNASSSNRNCWRIGTLLLALVVGSFAYLAEAQTISYSTKGASPLFRKLAVGGRVSVTLRTSEGPITLRLTRDNPWANPSSSRDLSSSLTVAPRSMRYFYGQSLNRRGETLQDITATLYNNKLVTYFFGPRRGRIFRAELSESGGVKLHHLPTTVSFSCMVKGVVPKNFHPVRESLRRTLTVVVDLDQSWTQQVGAAQEEALSALYMSHRVFSTQLRIALKPLMLHRYERLSDPYSASSPFSLLTQFRSSVLSGVPNFSSADLMVLFTARAPTDTVGISYVGGACTDFGQAIVWRYKRLYTPLVTAHELGHSIGATHPEESDSSQAPSLMSPYILNSTTVFSSFSRAEMASFFADSPACGR